MDFDNININNFSNPYIVNARLGDESGEAESEERRRYFLEIDLQIANLELFASSLSLLSSIYYLKASIVSKEIVVSSLNGIDSGLDATPYVDVGETLGLMVIFIFTYSSFLRYSEKSQEDPDHMEPYRKIALSYIPTLLAYITRISARGEIKNDLANI